MLTTTVQQLFFRTYLRHAHACNVPPDPALREALGLPPSSPSHSHSPSRSLSPLARVLHEGSSCSITLQRHGEGGGEAGAEAGAFSCVPRPLELNLENLKLNSYSFQPIRLALRELISNTAAQKLVLSRLDLRGNPYLRDASVKPLLGLVAPSHLAHLSLACTGISESLVITLFDCLSTTRLQQLSLAHNSLTASCFEQIALRLKLLGPRGRAQLPLSVLDLSDNKIGDKAGIKLVDAVLLNTGIAKLNLNKTALGYRTAAWLLRRLAEANSGSGSPHALRLVSLKFNGGISEEQKKQVTRLLEQRELDSIGELKREKREEEWLDILHATQRNVLQEKELSDRSFGRHAHSPYRSASELLHRHHHHHHHTVSINDTPHLAVVEFEQAPSRSQNSSSLAPLARKKSPVPGP